MPSFFNPITKMDFNNFFRKMDEYGAEVPDLYFKTKYFGYNMPYVIDEHSPLCVQRCITV